ncbi:hypothetical protein KEM56_002092 [Ascosphaera pollenicola]|nr:hypothetical protein KEM56_002092 [Ascosphaera pollenicola]
MLLLSLLVLTFLLEPAHAFGAGFMTFGYGTGEFEVTAERLGTYQTIEHIDNPLGYAMGEDAREYDPRLRGPVNEEVELAIDERTGLKKYISTEDEDIVTSATLVRRTLGGCIELGRRYATTGDKADLYEAFRLLGTGLHCLEDYAAHSNYTELALIELGEADIFPMVGSNTSIELEGAENNPSELQSLQTAIEQSENDPPSSSIIGKLLDRLPTQEAQEADDEDASPLEPERWAEYLITVQEKIYPIMRWHDRFMQRIDELVERIPVVPKMIQTLKDQMTLFVFTVLVPFVLPVINKVKAELQAGSSEIIESSKEQQLNIFYDDDCSNPTHSMLSKDHFSNVLNEPAGKIAGEIVAWTVPQIMGSWDDEEIDVNRTLTRIVYGVFHHPALRMYDSDGAGAIREIMFRVVEEWWNEQGEEGQETLRQQLGRDGIENGLNHKAGLEEFDHACAKPYVLPQAAHDDDEEEEDEEDDWGNIGEARLKEEAMPKEEFHETAEEEQGEEANDGHEEVGGEFAERPPSGYENPESSNIPEGSMPNPGGSEDAPGGGDPLAMLASGQGEAIVTDMVQEAVGGGPMGMVAGKVVHKLFERLEDQMS